MYTLNGIPLVVSEFLPDERVVHVPPRSRREQRKRQVIARRRKRAGLPAPTYTKSEGPYLLMLNGTLYGSLQTARVLIAESASDAARLEGGA
ncbi:MAG: hypothetical protein K2Y26_00090 [Gemmatimonadaceae bacterium]|nr:hypothetical protein [Gemmatimonadaceae bacterium]